DRAMIHFVLDRLEQAGIDRILVVVGHRSDLVREELAERKNVEFAAQTEQLGTGHAAQVCVPALAQTQGPVLIVTGDSPLLQTSSVESLFREFESSQPACILGTLHRADPTGLGRIVRTESGEFLGI